MRISATNTAMNFPLQDKDSTDSLRALAVVERSVYTKFAPLSSGLSQQEDISPA
jgi:hypothetical protein